MVDRLGQIPFCQILKICWLSFSILGLIFQSSLLTKSYFRYEVTTNIQMYIPEKIDLPVMVFCFDLRSVIKWDELSIELRRQILTVKPEGLTIKENELENITKIVETISTPHFRLTSSYISNIQDTFNISALFNMSIAADDMFTNWITYTPFDNETSFGFRTKIGQVSNWVKDAAMCYRLDIPTIYRKDLVYRLIRSKTIFRGLFSYFTPNPKYIHQLRQGYIMAVPVERPNPEIGAVPFLPIKVDPFQQYDITYDEYILTLLPPPYQTECRDYDAEGLSSRGKCFESCLKEKCLKAFGKLHPSLTVYHNESHELIPLVDLLHFVENKGNGHEADNVQKVVLDFQSECSSLCRQRQCINHKFVPKNLGTYAMPPAPEVEAGFTTYVTLSPIIQAEVLPQQSIVQFLADLSSVFGFWLGFNILGLDDIVIKCISMVRTKKTPDRRRISRTSPLHPSSIRKDLENMARDRRMIQATIRKDLDDMARSQLEILAKLKRMK